jgi:hypothetical protein
MVLAERYKEQFPETVHILDIAWVSPFGSRSIENPYTREIDSEDFSNIGRHCVAVANTAERISNHLLVQGAITQEQMTNIIKSAILHDGDKRLEVMRKNASKSGIKGTDGNPIDVYGEAWYATIVTIFSDVWIDPNILVTIKNMGGMTAHNSVRKFLTMQDGEIVLNPERTLAEMIVHIADDMTHSPNPDIDNPTIVTNFEERANLGRLGISSNGTIRDVRDIANSHWNSQDEKFISYYEWMEIVFQLICSHLQRKIDPTSHMDSVKFVVWLVNSKASDIQDGVSQKVGNTL